MTFFYNLNKKLDGIRAKPETTHGQLNERDMSRAAKGYEKYGKEGMADEGNAFSGAVAKAKADGIQPGEKIRVGGKEMPLKEKMSSAKKKAVDEGEVTPTKGGIKHKSTGPYGGSKDEPHFLDRIKGPSDKQLGGTKKKAMEEKEDLNPFTNFKKPRKEQPKVGDVEHGSKHDIEHTATGRKVTRRVDPQGNSVGSETDDEGNKKEKRTSAGRPTGPAKKPERTTAKAYKHKGERKVKEGGHSCPHCGHEIVDEVAPDSKSKKFAALAEPRDKITYADKIAGAKAKQGKVKEEAVEEPKASKGGMSYGKGIYDSLNRDLEAMISESINVSVNMTKNDQGEPNKSITVSAEGADADKLAELLSLAGMHGHGSGAHSSETCGDCGQSPCACDDVVDENSPDWPTNHEVTGGNDPLMRRWSAGLNGPKSTGQTTVPVVASQLRRQSSMESADIGMQLYAELKQFKAT